MMNTATIRQKLHNYLELADEKKLKAIYTIVQEDIDKQNDFSLSEEQIQLLEEEREKYLKGEGKSYNWDEVKDAVKKKDRK